MLKKLIKTTDGIVELNINELILKFDNMVKKFAHECKEELSGYENNPYDFDDYYQMGLIKISEVFEKYDIDKGACFSTLLFRELNNKMVMIIRELEAEKRKPTQSNVYINDEIEGCEIINVIKGDEDTYFEREFSLEQFLSSRLTITERVLVAMAFKKDYYKSKGVYKSSLDYAMNMFSDELIDVTSISKNELADLLNISRPTLNKKINEAMEKVKELAQYYIYQTYAQI